MEDVFAVYIWSDDWWIFSPDTWLEAPVSVYANSEVIPPSAINWQRVIDGEAYHASLYFEVGKTDAHGFKPESISADGEYAKIVGVQLDIEGNEIGEPEPYEYTVGVPAWYEALRLGRAGILDFKVTKIIPAVTEDDKEEIITYIEEIQDADMTMAEESVGIAAAETFEARKTSKSKKRRAGKRGGRGRHSNSLMQRKNFGKKKTRAKGYSPHGYAENFGAETFKSEGESQSDAIAAESSKAVEGLNPTPVSDGQWLAETINKKAEARHNYPHRVIEGDNYRHYDGSGRRGKSTNRGASIRADRRRYRPNANLKPGQGHMGDFVREAQGYDDRLDESLGMSKRDSNLRQSFGDRRRESAGMERALNRRKYSRVGTMDRTRRRLRAESAFDKVEDEVADEYEERGMSREKAMDIGGAVAYDAGVKKYDRLSGGHGKEIMQEAAREGVSAKYVMRRNSRRGKRAEMTSDDRDMMGAGMERFIRQRRTHRAESPTTSPKDYSPTGESPTAENPKADGPSSAGTGDQVISVESPSAPPDDVKFAENLSCKTCAAEDYRACGCERRSAEMKNEPTNATASGDDPLVADATNQPGSEMVDVDSPSAPPPNIFDSSAETFMVEARMCACGNQGTYQFRGTQYVTCEDCLPKYIGSDSEYNYTLSDYRRLSAETVTKNADMNYDGSLYGEQYFPDALTANQVKVGELGSTESGDGSGQGVLEWDGSRVGPSPPDEKAAEIISRRGLAWILSAAAVVGGVTFGLRALKEKKSK